MRQEFDFATKEYGGLCDIDLVMESEEEIPIALRVGIERFRENLERISKIDTEEFPMLFSGALDRGEARVLSQVLSDDLVG